MDRIVFVSLFLGLVSGRQWLDMRADPAVQSIVVTLDGREMVRLTRPPWQIAIDFGTSIEPKRLVATGLSGSGEPIASGSQLINVPKNFAEVQITIEQRPGAPPTVKLFSRHLEKVRPRRARIYFDGMELRVGKNFTATLPQYDETGSHSIAAEMRFRDGTVAFSEMVVHGGFAMSTEAQLTAIAVRSGKDAPSDQPEGCFSVGGKPVRATWDESEEALLVLVKDPDARSVNHFLDPDNAMLHRGRRGEILRADAPLDTGTKTIVIWPVSKRIEEPGFGSSRLFPSSDDRNAKKGGMRWQLTQGAPPAVFPLPRQYADAVAVAGLTAMRSGSRRAVVYLAGRNEDESHHRAAEVRQFLAAIGVPLFVWSAEGPRDDLEQRWGRVEDVSTDEGLATATKKLREELASQRIVWVAADPLDALRVEIDARCEVNLVAKSRAE